jgi:hypothetical protein
MHLARDVRHVLCTLAVGLRPVRYSDLRWPLASVRFAPRASWMHVRTCCRASYCHTLCPLPRPEIFPSTCVAPARHDHTTNRGRSTRALFISVHVRMYGVLRVHLHPTIALRRTVLHLPVVATPCAICVRASPAAQRKWSLSNRFCPP